MSTSLALSICVLFFSLMQLLKWSAIFNYYIFSIVCCCCVWDCFSCTSIYFHYNHINLTFSTFNLTIDSAFSSTQNFIIFWYLIIILLKFVLDYEQYHVFHLYIYIHIYIYILEFLYHFNISSLIISCFSFGDIYLSLVISLLCSFVTVSEVFCFEFVETFVIS